MGNPNSPANSVAAQLYQENRREYEKRVAAIVEQSWLNFPDDSGDEEGAKKSDPTEAAEPSNHRCCCHSCTRRTKWTGWRRSKYFCDIRKHKEEFIHSN